MKKLFTLLLLLCISYSFYNCSSDDNDDITSEEDKTITCKSFDRIMSRLYKGSPSDGWTPISLDSVVANMPENYSLYRHVNIDCSITFLGDKDSLITDLPLPHDGYSTEYCDKIKYKYKFENGYLMVWLDSEKKWVAMAQGSKDKINFTHEYVQVSGGEIRTNTSAISFCVASMPDISKEQIDKRNIQSLNIRINSDNDLTLPVVDYSVYSKYDEAQMLWYMYTYNLE